MYGDVYDTPLRASVESYASFITSLLFDLEAHLTPPKFAGRRRELGINVASRNFHYTVRVRVPSALAERVFLLLFV